MAPEVRLNGPDNEPLGIVPIQALRMAGELDVDLVEIAATAVPPVCRLMDYGKFKYQEQKKAAEAKAKQKVIEIKEVKFRPVPMMATTTSSCATSAAFWPMATRSRSRCAFAAARSRTRSWAWPCSTACATIWPIPSWSSSFPSWKAAR
jgi:hypothetical protein